MAHTVGVQVLFQHPEAGDEPTVLVLGEPRAGGRGKVAGAREWQADETMRRSGLRTDVGRAQNAASDIAIIAALPALSARNRAVAWGKTLSMKKRALTSLAS